MLWQINQFLKPDYPFPAFFPRPVALEHGGHCQAVGRKVTVHTRGGEATQQVISDPDPETGWEPTSSSRETDFPLSPLSDLCCQQTLTRQKNKGSNHFNCADFSSENGLYRHNSIALEGSQPVALTPIFSLGVPRSHFYRILPHLLITCSWMLDTLVYVEFTESTISTFLKFTVFDASLAFLPRLENLNQAIRLQVLV